MIFIDPDGMLEENPPEWFTALTRLLTGSSGEIKVPKEVYIPPQTKKITKIVGTAQDINTIKDATVKGVKEGTKATGDILESSGMIIKGTGYVAAPFTEGTSLSLVPIGEMVEDIGTGINFVIDIENGNTKKAFTSAGSRILFGTTGKGIKNLKKLDKLSKTDETILNFLNEIGNQISNFIQKNIFGEPKNEK